MPQKTSPFLEGKWGWNFGESGWNSGADENWLKFSYLFDANVDSIVSTLPAAVNGEAYFLTTDNRIYFVVDGTYYSTPVPKWFEFKIKSTGEVYKFNGTAVVTVPDQQDLDNRVDVLEADFDSLADPLTVTNGAALIARGGQVVDSVAAIRLLSKDSPSKFAFATAHTSTRQGLGGGAYRFDGSDMTSADNNGTIIVANDGGRWKLIFNGWITPEHFGAVGDKIADDSVPLQSALNVCSPTVGLHLTRTYRHTQGLVAGYTYNRFGGGANAHLIFDPAAGQTVALTIKKALPSPTDNLCYFIDHLSINLKSTAGTCTAIKFVSDTTTATQVIGVHSQLVIYSLNIVQTENADVSYWRHGLDMYDCAGVVIHHLSFNNRLPAAQEDVNVVAIRVNRPSANLSLFKVLVIYYAYIQRAYHHIQVTAPNVESIYIFGGEFVGSLGSIINVATGAALQAVYVSGIHADFSGKFWDSWDGTAKVVRFSGCDIRKQSNGSTPTADALFRIGLNSVLFTVNGNVLIGQSTVDCYQIRGNSYAEYAKRIVHSGNAYDIFANIFSALTNIGAPIIFGSSNAYSAVSGNVYNFSSSGGLVKDSDTVISGIGTVNLSTSPMTVTVALTGFPKFFSTRPLFANLVATSSALGSTLSNVRYDLSTSTNAQAVFVLTGTWGAATTAVGYSWQVSS